MTAPAHLRAYLVTLSTEELRHCLEERPDVLVGTPLQSFDDLAARLVARRGAGSALVGCTRPELRVLAVLIASGAGASAARTVDLLHPAHAGGEREAHVRVVGGILATLRARALIWPAGDLLAVNPAARESLALPLGLGRQVEDLIAEYQPQQLETAVQAWAVDLPTTKAGLVERVVAGVGDPEFVRRLVGTAPAPVADYLRARANRLARANGGSPAEPAAATERAGAQSLGAGTTASSRSRWLGRSRTGWRSRPGPASQRPPSFRAR